MVDHTAWRLDLAPIYIQPYAERAPIAVLGGSVAQGVADRWSDIDTIVYWDAIDREWLETPRAAENGMRFTWVEHYPGNACLEQYRFGTVKADVGARAARLARRADRRMVANGSRRGHRRAGGCVAACD